MSHSLKAGFLVTRPFWFRTSPIYLLTNITVRFRCLHVTISGKVFTTTNTVSESVILWFICSHTTSITCHFCRTILMATSTDSLENKFIQDINSLTSGKLLFQDFFTYDQCHSLNTDLFCLFCCFTSQVNSYGHGGTVSSPNHTFSWASLNKRLTSALCTFFCV